ncbi:MAG: prolyl-tRNA synthetase associated domain-containing protein [Rhodospirillales bacterium]
MIDSRPAPSPATPEDLFARLDALGIAVTTHAHDPVFTVEESKAGRGALPGGHCKSLFLKDKNGTLWLVVALEDTRIDLKTLAKTLGAGRLSFAKPDLMRTVLGVEPGAVTPFALINESARPVRVVLDSAMMAGALLNYHPLKNDRTTAIAPAGLRRFIEACGYEPRLAVLGAALEAPPAPPPDPGD